MDIGYNLKFKTTNLGLVISGISQPSVALQEDGRSEVLVAVPPVGRAGCGATGAQNALVPDIVECVSHVT